MDGFPLEYMPGAQRLDAGIVNLAERFGGTKLESDVSTRMQSTISRIKQ